jgi:hypothetical protein
VADKWIQKAITRPGALTAAAKKAGAVNKSTGKIDPKWISTQTHSDNARRAAQANLAQRLASMRKKK